MVRLLVRFADESEAVIRPNLSVRFERILPLKVDLLDFIRIAEVAHLLKVKGKEIWEGFTLDGIPFLLEGDEGQWVLINHPKPPKGFVRYDGLLPKVSFPMTVYVGWAMDGEEQREEFVGGWLQKVNGIWTAALPYSPRWWALLESIYYFQRQPDAVKRLEAIIHEAFHVWWMRFIKDLPIAEPRKKMTAPLAELSERECIAKALEAESAKEAKQWSKAFLHWRKQRRKEQGLTTAQVNLERFREWIEGLATFVGWKALEAGQAPDYKPISAMKADPEWTGYSERKLQELSETLKLRYKAMGDAHAFGMAQLILLERWGFGWRKGEKRFRNRKQKA